MCFIAQIVTYGIKKNKFFLICAQIFVPLHAENRHYEQATINHGSDRHVARGERTGIRQPARPHRGREQGGGQHP